MPGLKDPVMYMQCQMDWGGVIKYSHWHNTLAALQRCAVFQSKGWRHRSPAVQSVNSAVHREARAVGDGKGCV